MELFEVQYVEGKTLCLANSMSVLLTWLAKQRWCDSITSITTCDYVEIITKDKICQQ